MRISLKYPFKVDWDYGYLNMNNEGRRIIHLYENSGKTRTISYARYLVSVDLERYLFPFEEVDHVDDDKTNDKLINLQILSPTQNRQKQGRLNRFPLTHGSLSAYRYCKCDKCKLGKRLYSLGEIEAYRKLISVLH